MSKAGAALRLLVKHLDATLYAHKMEGIVTNVGKYTSHMGPMVLK
jgi:hypothetical protein